MKSPPGRASPARTALQIITPNSATLVSDSKNKAPRKALSAFLDLNQAISRARAQKGETQATGILWIVSRLHLYHPQQFARGTAVVVLLCSRLASGALAGTGKSMAPKRRQIKTAKPERKTSRATRSKKAQPSAAETPESSPQSVRRTEPDPNGIFDHLQQRAMAGDQGSANVVVRIAEKSKHAKPAAKKKPGLTCAQRLALEPPWEGEDSPGLLLPQAPPQA